MGNQAGKNKGGESGDAEAGSDDKSKRSMFGKQKFSDKISRPGPGSLNSNSSMHSWSASQPIDCGDQADRGSGGGECPLKTTSPSSLAMPVPSPKNIPIGVPGKVVPYKRPKGTIEWDSEEEEEEDEAAKRDIRKDKVSLLDFEPLKVIGNGCFGKVMMVKFNKNGQIYAMKSIRKAHVVKNNKVRHTLAERNIMQKITHPFVMKLHYAFQNNGKLYMVMDYLNGGDIFYHLSISRRFPEERARFYAAEVLMALECLHEHGFIYRDLKPENVLTDSEGHIRLTDFGLSKEHFEEGQAMTTFVGTTEYLAPEVLKQKGYGKEVDWWSLGVLIFEMLTGCPPFYSKNRQMTFRMILSAELNIPDWISTPAKSMMKDLLMREPSQRLGHGTRGAADIKRHAFFSTLDFPALYRKETPPPYKPTPLALDDTSNFDTRFTAKPAEDSPTQSPEEATAFENFSYQSPNFRGKSFMGERNGSYRDTVGSFGQVGRSSSYSSNAAGSFRGGSSLRGAGGGLSSGGGSGGKKMLPRINSGEVLSEQRHSIDNEDLVIVPKAVQEDSVLADDSNDSEDAGDRHSRGGDAGDRDSVSKWGASASTGSVDSGNNSDADEVELLGSSLIQSSLADKTPRWRQHDSEARATAASKGEARGSDSSDEEEDVAAAHARVDSRVAAGAKDSKPLNESGGGAAADADAFSSSPPTPSDGAMQFGFEE